VRPSIAWRFEPSFGCISPDAIYEAIYTDGDARSSGGAVATTAVTAAPLTIRPRLSDRQRPGAVGSNAELAAA
jgi:hypothetical protein